MEWGPGPPGRARRDAGSCQTALGTQFLEAGQGCRPQGAASRGVGVNTQTHSRHGLLEGRRVGAGQGLTGLNRFSLKSYLGLQGFFSFPFIFLKSYEKEQVDCGLQNGGVSCFLCFFLWGLRVARGVGWTGGSL